MSERPTSSPRQDTGPFREPAASLRCTFCLEAVKPGASVCPHCGGVLISFSQLLDRQLSLEARLDALTVEITALRAMPVQALPTTDAPAAAKSAQHPAGSFGWPHMADNLFLGLTALLAAHWLVTTLPGTHRAVYRLAALAVAMPFGFRFQAYAHGSLSEQVLSALAFGGLGTFVVGILDIALAGGVLAGVSMHDLAASVAAIALSHLAGSFWADVRRKRIEQAASPAQPPEAAAVASLAIAMTAIRQVKPDKIQSNAAAVKAVTDAAAAIIASAAAVWAAFSHILS